MIGYDLLQMDDLPETAELIAFVRVVDTRSLSRAAKELRLPRSTVGRRLQRLEERLGIRLLKRTTRRQALTDAGAEFYQHARHSVEALERARATVQRPSGKVEGRVRISVPTGAPDSLGELFGQFSLRHPDVVLEVDSNNANVDLIHGGFDLALRSGPVASAPLNLVSRTLGTSTLVCVATPAYLARAGTPKRATDLRRHACLSPFVRGEAPSLSWPRLKGGSVRIHPRMTSNDMFVLLGAARASLGIALLPDFLAQAEVASGALARVLATQIGAQTLLSVVYHERELMPLAVRTLIDFIVETGLPTRQCGEAGVAHAKDPRRPKKS
ncbi:LysR family transcriptional regulator [Corallococcus sp. EGB]|uniref:LysR family transcriptional regulator n=1 Tax=Corallococcus sp. EGB TaxID=1521117 RepID=UPI001CBBC5D2|nr:LysR family transcriptional regulator [Corallococcus sp. EGB]